jgi:3alpha(or 20beta)-hydroxysteroid dehydrogenase
VEARQFVAAGAKVVLTDLRIDEALAAELGQQAVFLEHDVTNADRWRFVVDTALSRFGKVDILVNNAGVYIPRALQDTDAVQFDLHYRVNQLGPFLGMQAVIEPMRTAGGGSIINISSVSGLRGYGGVFAYSASKWALRGMTLTAASDLAPFNIRVNCVHPGAIESDMMRANPPEAIEALQKTIPARRFGTADDIASVVLFLASDAAGYMTGAAIPVTGGMEI